MADNEPTDAPPSYEKATGKHPTKNGITPQARRSMEDELRPLPKGWVRQFDAEHAHQFYVDTTKDPPRAIWHHPYDDEDYLVTLSPEERANLNRLNRSVSLKDIEAESSEDEDGPSTRAGTAAGAGAGASSSSASSAQQLSGVHKFGRRLKDKLTQTTHEERERERRQRAEQERRAYEMHLAARRAMARAIQTGQPQFAFKDSQGREVYIEPPNGPGAPPGAYGYNPYQTGPYSNANAVFVRPQQPYYRPYGYGYGGGVGLPIAGGLLGGALLGSLFF